MLIKLILVAPLSIKIYIFFLFSKYLNFIKYIKGVILCISAERA